MAVYPSQYAPIPTPDLENWNTDRSVDPVVMTRGVVYKTGGSYYIWDGQSRSDDAALMRVSSIGGSFSAAPLSADSSSVSCISDDAGKMRVSAIGVSVTTSPLSASGSSISAVQNDAGFLHVSAIGLSDVTTVSAHLLTTQITRVSTDIMGGSIDNSSFGATQVDAGLLRISAYADDAAKFRVSSIGSLSANQQISAYAIEATAHIGSVSAVLVDDASITKFLGRVSSVGGGGGLSASQSISSLGLEGTAHIGQVSAILVDNPVNATYLGRISGVGTFVVSAHEVKQSDASALRISAYSDDAAKFRVYTVSTVGLSASQSVSARILEGTAFIGQVSSHIVDDVTIVQSDADALFVSAKSKDAGLFHVSAYMGDATNLRVSTFSSVANGMVVSAAQANAALFRTSSYIPVDTIGSLSVFRSLSLSASQAIKATAGAVYGYYLFNTTTVPQYVKLTNTSGAINVGTDVPIATLMIPVSGAANVWFGQGLLGFTAGIGIHASSAIADNATTPAAASAVGGNIFYN